MKNTAIIGLSGLGIVSLNYLKEQISSDATYVSIQHDENANVKTTADTTLIASKAFPNQPTITSIFATHENVIILTNLGEMTEKNLISPLIQLGKETNTNVISLVSMPFNWEGKERSKKALELLSLIKEEGNTVGALDYNRLKDTLKQRANTSSLTDAFNLFDDTFVDIIQNILLLEMFDKEKANTLIAKYSEPFILSN